MVAVLMVEAPTVKLGVAKRVDVEVVRRGEACTAAAVMEA